MVTNFSSFCSWLDSDSNISKIIISSKSSSDKKPSMISKFALLLKILLIAQSKLISYLCATPKTSEEWRGGKGINECISSV